MNLSNLSHIDFEELCIDLVQRDTGKKFSSFGAGADGGIDGRHSKTEDLIVLQCKHYLNSSSTDLLRAAKKELLKLKKLNPSRYIFITSYPLTVGLSDKLEAIFKPYIISKNDIWGQQDICSALRTHQDIFKVHIKLWLTDTIILEQVLNSGLENFTNITKEEIIEEARVYVRNDSYDEAFSLLEDRNTLIVSGPPGVGKTTLAKMVCYQYLKDGWKFYSISSLAQGYEKITESEPTLFFFDDFLGKIELNKAELISNESALATFVRRVQNSKSTKFILTTRSHIYEEARNLSESIDSERFHLSKYILDVGIYTRKIKAHILFNHLSVSRLTHEHIAALLEDNWLSRIIDHKNYNPRIVSQLSSESLGKSTPKAYPASFISALDNPTSIWEKAYRSLEGYCQHLLITLFFHDGFWGADINELRKQYQVFHRAFSLRYGKTQAPNEFEDALRILESGFISISGLKVDFVNPSVRDFLKAYIKDIEFINLVMCNAVSLNFGFNVWKQMKHIALNNKEAAKEFSYSIQTIIPKILNVQTHITELKNGFFRTVHSDTSISERLSFLIDVYSITVDFVYLETSKQLLVNNKLEIDAGSDARGLALTHAEISIMEDIPQIALIELRELIENKLIFILSSYMHIEDLSYAIDHIYEYLDSTALENLQQIINRTVRTQISEVELGRTTFDDVDEIELYLDGFNKISEVTGIDVTRVTDTLHTISEEYEEQAYPDKAASHQFSNRKDKEDFSNEDMKSLFYKLIE